MSYARLLRVYSVNQFDMADLHIIVQRPEIYYNFYFSSFNTHIKNNRFGENTLKC